MSTLKNKLMSPAKTIDEMDEDERRKHLEGLAAGTEAPTTLTTAVKKGSTEEKEQKEAKRHEKAINKIEEESDKISTTIKKKPNYDLGKRIETVYKRHGKLLDLSPEQKKDFDQQIADLKKIAKEAKAVERTDRNRTEWYELADKLGQALAQIGMAMYAGKTGMSMAGVQFKAGDWSRQYQQIKDELNQKLAEVREDKAGVVKRRDAALKRREGQFKDIMAAEMEGAKMGIEAGTREREMSIEHVQNLEKKRLDSLYDEVAASNQFLRDMDKEEFRANAKTIADKIGKGETLTEGQKAFWKAMGKKSADIISNYTERGELAQQAIDAVNMTIAELEGPEGEKLSGIWVGLAKEFNMGATSLADIAFSKAMTTESRIIRKTATALRETLGHQFTEKETIMILGTYFKAGAPPKENAQRLKEFMADLQQAQDDKRRRYEVYLQQGGDPELAEKELAKMGRVKAPTIAGLINTGKDKLSPEQVEDLNLLEEKIKTSKEAGDTEALEKAQTALQQYLDRLAGAK